MIKGLMRAAIRGFGELAPKTAAAWFERQLMTPRQAPQPDLAPPATIGRSGRVPFDNGEIALTEWGHGPVVLLVHGWGGSSRSLWRMVDPLVARGLRPVAIDLPAHGESDGRYTNMPECAEALLRVTRAMGPVHGAIAHSFGSPTTALAVRRGLELKRLVMVGPPRSVHDSLREIARQIGLPDHVFARMARAFAARLQFDWAELDTDWMVARLGLALLVVHDEEDRVTPWTHGAAVARAAQRGTLFTTAGLGHRAVLANERVVDRIVEFVAEEESAPQVA